MIFLVSTADSLGYHRHNPITGKWTGWQATIDLAITARLSCNDNIHENISLYIADKAHCEQIIKRITIGTKHYSLEEFQNLHPEYFI